MISKNMRRKPIAPSIVADEIVDIRRECLTWFGYMTRDRSDKTVRLNRANRRYIYDRFIKEPDFKIFELEDKKRDVYVSKRASLCYDIICQYRDEVFYMDA